MFPKTTGSLRSSFLNALNKSATNSEGVEGTLWGTSHFILFLLFQMLLFQLLKLFADLKAGVSILEIENVLQSTSYPLWDKVEQKTW